MGADIYLEVHGDGLDAGEREHLFRLLRAELLQLPVDDVTPRGAGEAPPGARGLGDVIIGLLVTAQPTWEMLDSLVNTVRNWLTRADGERSVRLEIDGDVLELTGTTEALQTRLADEWIRLHSME
ncbi:hypothetical protein Acor_36150 [Acrocarpospora corrugata]|uniref:Uncharacterized protein n=1 Tax=Acrocarpospora corrugata TaxID=35763 RepID=A0A5M3W337_9ACTN|nr:hypothetical protein [Acrocarpospora corrugata]GES01551.1 hypothetical protein Acor_36150 [Acrocarpospora corrugata]